MNCPFLLPVVDLDDRHPDCLALLDRCGLDYRIPRRDFHCSRAGGRAVATILVGVQLCQIAGLTGGDDVDAAQGKAAVGAAGVAGFFKNVYSKKQKRHSNTKTKAQQKRKSEMLHR